MVSPIEEVLGFQTEIQAIAENMDGFTVRRDFEQMVGDYIRKSKDVVLWPLLRKQPAEADLVQELVRNDMPNTGFFDKNDMTGLIETPTNNPHHDFTDPPQAVKAGGGLIRISYYSQSLYNQQGMPWGNIIAEKTEDLVSSSIITLEKALWKGNATTNPRSFNGIEAQMNPANAYTADTTTDPPDIITRKLRGICRLAMWDEKKLRNITHIFTSGLGCELLENEMDDRLNYQNLDTITPGLKVPTILTHAGRIPVIPSPFITDTDNGGEGNDQVTYYLVDLNQIKWKGVYPKGGASTFNPQIFDVSTWTNDTMQYLVEKRLCLFFGTLKLYNKGECAWKLTVDVEPGRVGSI